MHLKYWNRSRFGCPEIRTWEISNEFEWEYDQNNFRNEFPDYENIGVDTLFELVGAIVCVLCHNACQILKSEKDWLSRNKYLGALKWVCVKICSKYFQKWILWLYKHRYRHFIWACRCHSFKFYTIKRVNKILKLEKD